MTFCSPCCHAAVEVRSSRDWLTGKDDDVTTCWHICGKCREACDPIEGEPQ